MFKISITRWLFRIGVWVMSVPREWYIYTYIYVRNTVYVRLDNICVPFLRFQPVLAFSFSPVQIDPINCGLLCYLEFSWAPFQFVEADLFGFFVSLSYLSPASSILTSSKWKKKTKKNQRPILKMWAALIQSTDCVVRIRSNQYRIIFGSIKKSLYLGRLKSTSMLKLKRFFFCINWFRFINLWQTSDLRYWVFGPSHKFCPVFSLIFNCPANSSSQLAQIYWQPRVCLKAHAGDQWITSKRRDRTNDFP